MRYAPGGPVDNKSALVQEMAWRRTGDKPVFEPTMAHFFDACTRPRASMN